MSGGHFNSGNYVYHKMVDFADQLEFELSDLQAGDPAHYFCQETRDKLKREISRIREFAKMMKKIDYLFSSDIGEETFLEEG